MKKQGYAWDSITALGINGFRSVRVRADIGSGLKNLGLVFVWGTNVSCELELGDND